MGTGSSGLGGGAKKKAKVSSSANTPSGIDYKGFMAMSDAEKYDTINKIIDDANIKVPDYLDGSQTSKFIYAIGMANKPKVVSDDELEKMPGHDLYRTVYDVPSPPPYSADILDQIRNGDYTQLSGSGGSAHGRALYFATSSENPPSWISKNAPFVNSADYGVGRSNPLISRAKINSGAKIAKESDLKNAMSQDSSFMSKTVSLHSADRIALYAISKGYDGWRDDLFGYDYAMIINRGVLTMSNKNKKAVTPMKTLTGRIKKKNGKPVMTTPVSWDKAEDA